MTRPLRSAGPAVDGTGETLRRETTDAAADAAAGGRLAAPSAEVSAALEALDDTSTLAGRLFQASPLPWAVVDAEGRIVRINEQLTAELGWTRADLLGRPVEVLVPERLRAPHRARRAAWFEAPRTRPMASGLEVHVLRRDGTERVADIQLSPMRVGDARLALAVLRDVTEDRARERRLREAHEALQAAHAELAARADELRRLNEHKNELLGMAAHDLRTPLAVVHGYSDLLAMLARSATYDDIRDVVGHIRRAIERMRLLLDDLLDLAAVEAGTLRLEPTPGDLGTHVEALVAEYGVLAAARRMQIRVERPAALPAVSYDHGRMEQVVQNLLSNALKYAPEGTDVAVRLRAVGDGPGASRVRLEVEDQGPGISAETAARLFQPFATGDAVPTSGEKAVGLGLAITRRIVEGHGGAIGVDGRPGLGARFWVELPAAS